jgi:hypothetical protein
MEHPATFIGLNSRPGLVVDCVSHIIGRVLQTAGPQSPVSVKRSILILALGLGHDLPWLETKEL